MIAENRRARQRLAVRDAVTGALAEANSLAEAAPTIVRAVCEALEWEFGALWEVEPHLDALRCVEVWHAPPGRVPEFEAATRSLRLARGAGIPGRVWASAAPVWIADVTADGNFPRGAVATKEGLRGALGFPIISGDHCVGVMEFFSAGIQQPDDELLGMLTALGSQIGQFVERRSAEQQLERYFRLSLDMLCVANHAGYFIRVNPAWERTLGFTMAEMTSAPIVDFVHPDDREKTVAEMGRLSEGQDTVSFENRYRAKDGSYRWMQWNATPFVQEQLIYAAARDITERKRAEEHIHRLREEAEAANRAKSEFLARMSHEMRTPLNVVIGMGDVLERTSLTAEQRQYVRLAQNAGSDLLALINDLLDLSKAEAGRITLEEVDFDLPGLLRDAIDMMAPRTRQKRVSLHCAVASGVPARLRGDPARLRQVVMNLLSNAVKFTPKGRIDLRVEPGEEGLLRFTVADTGIGIPAAKLDAIFEAFTQADASTTRKYGGTGLGLAISQHLVELMGGRLWVTSQPGVGSTFHFTARFAAAGPEEAARPDASAEKVREETAGSLAGLRVLVADDSAENRFLVREYLRDFDCRIEEAENGETAVEKFRTAGGYGLVLMDLQMPVMDGFEATRRIRDWEREQQRTPAPILALTASVLEGELQRSLVAGCNACIRKPVRLNTLIQAIGEHLGKQAKLTSRIQVRVDARLRKVVPGYLQSRRGDVGTIGAALVRADFESIRELGHKMNGSGSAYGFPRITELGQALEHAARARDAVQIRTSTAELAEYLDRVDVI